MQTCYVDPDTRAIADLHLLPSGVWRVSRINVPRGVRGCGHGRALLQRILNDADAEGVTLTLEPLASGQFGGGLTGRQLVQWYQRHGFVWQPSAVSTAHVLVRTPKSLITNLVRR